MKRFWIGLILLAIILFGFARLYYYLTDDFRVSNMTYDLPYNKEWATPAPTVEEKDHLKHILDQPFHYIGKGAQVYAFGSEDGQYVIKFFKFKHIRPSIWVDMLPSIPPFKAYKEDKKLKKAGKVFKVFNGYKLAFDHDKENTQLIYIHLNKTDDLKLNVTIVDKIGFERNLHLDDVIFILQRRGVTLRTKLTEDFERGDILAAQKHVIDILAMYLSEYKIGIYDRDHGVAQNTGFIGDKPFHLDVGKFSYGEEFKNPEFYQPDLIWVAAKIKKWIYENFPAYEQAMTQAMEIYLSEQFKFPVDLTQAQMSHVK